MNMLASRARLLGDAAVGLGLAMITAQPARADSVCATGLIGPQTLGANCTSPIGNGHSEVTADTSLLSLSNISPASVLTYLQEGDSGLTTGYLESTTAGRGVLSITTNQAFTYVGTGSTLFGSAAATGATILSITGPSVTLSSGSLTALGAGSTALSVTTNGGAGSGGINATIDGNIFSLNGPGIVLNSANAAATGNVDLTSNGPVNISGAGDAINITTAGSNRVLINLDGSIAAFGGAGVRVTDTANGGDISVTTTDVFTTGATSNAIDIRSFSTSGDVTYLGNGTVTAGRAGVHAEIFNPLASGDVTVLSFAPINAPIGIEALNFGFGFVDIFAESEITATTGNAIFAQSEGGAVRVITGLGAVSSVSNTAIVAVQDKATGSGAISVTTAGAISGTAGISAINSGTGEVTIATTGLVTGTAGPAISATNNNAASTGNLLVTVGAGGATATGDTISATSAGTGTVTVNSGGPIASSTATGIVTSATTGATVINVTGGSVTGFNGISATSSGTITANVTGGNVTGIGMSGVLLDSTAAKVVNVSAGRSVSNVIGSVAVRFDGGSTGTLNNAGTIGIAGAVAVFASSATATTINNLAGGTINGTISLSSGNDTLNNSGTWNANGLDGFNNFGAGTDEVNNLAGGIINLNTGSTLGGLDTLSNAGTINAAGTLTFTGAATALTNSGTFNLATASAVSGLGATTNAASGIINAGAGSSLAGTGPFSNAGTLNTAGTFSLSGYTSFSNSGTFNLAAASAVTGLGATTNAASGIINAGAGSSLAGTGVFSNAGTLNSAGAFNLSGFTSFSNSGILDLAPGIFTVPAALFTNTGTIRADEGATTITGQTNFANSGSLDLQDGVTGDVLTINSGFVGSGGSNLQIDVSSTAADVLVITGAASGSSVINVTPVGGVVVNSSGILVVDTGTSTATAFTLGSTFGTSLIDYRLAQQGQDYFLFAEPNANAFDPLALTNMVTDIWYQSADVYGAYSAQRRGDLGGQPSRRLGLWGQVYWGIEKYGDTKTQSVFGRDVAINSRVETKRRGAQAGIDHNFGGAVLGITGGYERADTDLRATPGGVDTKGWNVGAYALVGASTGFYVGVLGKYDHAKAELTNLAFDGTDKLTLKSWGIEGEAGYRWAVGNSKLDFGGGLAWVNSKIGDFTASGITYDFDKTRSLRGRVGVRFEAGTRFGPYIDARLLHEFRDSNDVTLLSGVEIDTLEREGRGTWGRLEVGIGAHGGAGPMVAAWGEIGDVKGIGARAGFRF